VTVIRRVLAASRFLVLIGVAGSFAAFVILLVAGAIHTGRTLARVVAVADVSAAALKTLALACIETVDVFLLATVFYIVAVGLYELFVDEAIELPAWLVIHDLDDLKGKLAGVVVVVLGVLFLGHAVRWDGGGDLLSLGASIALVIGALTYFLRHNLEKPKAGPGP
jgi:uncharacterized membrane protein YqhA